MARAGAPPLRRASQGVAGSGSPHTPGSRRTRLEWRSGYVHPGLVALRGTGGRVGVLASTRAAPRRPSDPGLCLRCGEVSPAARSCLRTKWARRSHAAGAGPSASRQASVLAGGRGLPRLPQQCYLARPAARWRWLQSWGTAGPSCRSRGLGSDGLGRSGLLSPSAYQGGHSRGGQSLMSIGGTVSSGPPVFLGWVWGLQSWTPIPRGPWLARFVGYSAS